MRAGGCTVQQALTAEAAAVVKQAVSLARRRGNAQVTPVHVASAMLATPSGMLRAACLRSHSHPLQCKALELCFNVALNRLPASAAATSPLLGHHHHYPPSLSNALVAAFKRAQAHQRRGSLESQQQQQPVLAVKIELEQLVVSILDDPSVSRVMREAGFSSTQVKANVEIAVCSNTTTTPQNPNPSSTTTTNPPQETKANLSLDQVRDEDVNAILDAMATRTKRRLVVVAECAAAAEAAARAAVDKIKRGEAAHDALRCTQLVSLRVSSFRDTPREDAERRLAELRCVVRNRRGQVVLLLEDLKWATQFWAGRHQGGRIGYYCAVEHVITEVRALACSGGGGGDGLWLIGFGTYQTYMRCKTGQPSLESLWGLLTLTVPAGSLSLSLTCATDGSALAVNHSIKANSDTNGNNGSASSWSFLDGSSGGGSGGGQLISRCCGDCSAAKIGTKALPRSFLSAASLPSWLQHCRDRESSHLTDLCKWSSICSPPSHRMTLHFSASVSPASSISSYEHGHHQPWLLAGLDAKHPWKANGEVGTKTKSHDSGTSNGSVEVECHSKFKELTAENLKLLCGALEKEAPCQREIIPEITSTVLRCRSGMAKRRDTSRSAEPKEETWLLFVGGDADGKEKVARGLASLVFGSPKNFLSISLDSSSPSLSGSTEVHRSKRPRPEVSQAYLECLYQAIAENPHRVIMMEDVEQADKYCQLGIKEAIESGVVRSHGGEEAAVGDSIVILSCEGFDARSRACSPPSKQMKVEREHASDHAASSSSSSCFDLNLTVESDAGEQCFSGDVALLKAVDRTLFFRISEDLRRIS